MIEVELKITLICKCSCRSIYMSDDKNDSILLLIEKAYCDGWSFNNDKDFICSFCNLTK